MSMRGTGRLGCLIAGPPVLALLTTACAMQPARNQAASRPLNVLFIAVDDLRPTLGAYGDAHARTPSIDLLAERGLVFTRAYSQQSVCNPSRASLMTGRRPTTTRVFDNDGHFRQALPDVVTLPQYFIQHGYQARAVGKIYHDPAWAQDAVSWSAKERWSVTDEAGGKYVLEYTEHNGWKARATERMDVPENNYIDGRVADAAIQVLDEIHDRPFFLAVGFRRPHLPFSAPATYWDLYDREAMPLPGPAEPPEDVPPLALHDWAELRGYTDIPEKGPLSVDKQRELIHGYYAAVSYVDAQIGRLLEKLDEHRLRENTVVVLWSDHGFHLGEHGLWGKGTNFELDTRVPLILSVPGQRAIGTTRALVELVDLYPTLADLAGLDLPDGLEGTSLVPLLEEPDRAWKTAVFSLFPRQEKGKDLMGYSVRTDRFRYTEWVDSSTGAIYARELYDYEVDPRETKNLASSEQHADAVARLSALQRAGWQKAKPAEDR